MTPYFSFFKFQACRGNKVDKGIIVSYDEMDANNKGPKLYAIPVSADVLVMYSTFEGNYLHSTPLIGKMLSGIRGTFQKQGPAIKKKTRDLININDSKYIH